jgi:Ni,Fe-hydrogenase III small subunit
MDIRSRGGAGMTSNLWFLKGIKKGVITEKFPAEPPLEPPIRPSVMQGNEHVECPVDAITPEGKWEAGKCIFCRRCEPKFRPTGNQDLSHVIGELPGAIRRSFYIYPLDSGSCGACNMEFLSIFNPQYDANRLKIFMTNSPRHADALLVMGVKTDGMEQVLREALEAMPGPKVVIAMGACAISGGIIGSAPISKENVTVEVAGCPPSPYSIISAIVKMRGD